MPRTDEEILAGVVRVRLGHQVVDIPERTIDATTDWQRQLAETVGGAVTGDLADTAAMTGLLSAIGSGMNDLLVAYDTSGQITHERLRQATPTQAYLAFRTVLEAVYPYVRDVQTAAQVLLPIMRAGTNALASPSAGAPSTNGHSTPGATGHLTSVTG
jgi:hypothetical protein